jgi:hypothetical protein
VPESHPKYPPDTAVIVLTWHGEKILRSQLHKPPDIVFFRKYSTLFDKLPDHIRIVFT